MSEELDSPDSSQPASGATSEVDRIIEETGEAIEDYEVPLSIFNHSGIYERELQDIFGTAWIFIGHETEIPEPGDYALRYIGEDPFIFVRDEAGEVNVIFDCCRHRGTTVVRAEQGNASHFRCPYHGWTYSNDGDLVGVPHEDGYGDLDKDEYSLEHATRVDTYKGLVFASLAPEGPSLSEYLGDFTWYIDINLDLTAEGMEVIGEPFRWRLDSNWKLGAENFAGDSYHVPFAHQSGLGAGYSPKEFLEVFNRDEYQYNIADCGGHSIGILTMSPEDKTYLGYPNEVREHFERGNLTQDQWDIVERGYVFFGTVFPNFSVFSDVMDLRESEDDPLEDNLLTLLTIRKWQPRGPDEMELWSWTLAPKEAPEELKAEFAKVKRDTFAPGGLFEPDDTAVWESISRAAGTTFTNKSGMRRDFQMGRHNEEMDDWPGPGTAYETYLNDSTHLTQYKSWHKLMTGRPIDAEGS